MPEIWVSIEDEEENAYGSGPITTAESWQATPKLDAAGTFSFDMPDDDLKALLIKNKRIARCQGILDGAVTEFGLGIIDKLETSEGRPSKLRISGPDIMGELAHRSVHNLIVAEQDWDNLFDPTRGLVSWVRVDQASQPDPNIEIPLAFDGNVATTEAIYITKAPPGFPENQDYLYVGYDARFDQIELTFNGRVNTRDSTVKFQYFNGRDWTSGVVLADTTKVDGRSFAQNGIITIQRPELWVRYDAIEAGGDWFWIRFVTDEGNERIGDESGYFDLANVKVYADMPTTNGVNLIMAYAPSTWTRTGYPATASKQYLEFDGHTILEALVTLSEQGGVIAGEAIREHFRLGTGRSIDWLGATSASSGVRAVSPEHMIEATPEIAVIHSLAKTHESSELVTRVYPKTREEFNIYRPMLSHATNPAPDGYSQDVHEGWIQHDAAYLEFGHLEQTVRFDDVTLQQYDSYSTHPQYAADQLQIRAIEYLRTRAQINEFYRLAIVQFPELLKPGDTIDVVYKYYKDGVLTTNIDTIAAGTPLHILSSSLTVSPQGLGTVGLEVATIDRSAKTDADVVVDLVRARRSRGETTQSPGVGGGSVSCMRCYAEVIGDGVELSYIVTHGLRTGNIIVNVWDLLATETIKVAPTVHILDTNRIRVTFATAADVEQYRVVVTGFGVDAGVEPSPPGPELTAWPYMALVEEDFTQSGGVATYDGWRLLFKSYRSGSWVERQLASGTGTYTSQYQPPVVANIDGLFGCAVNINGTIHVYRSNDWGDSWSEVTPLTGDAIIAGNWWVGLAVMGNKFLLLDLYAGHIYTSTDLAAWTDEGDPAGWAVGKPHQWHVDDRGRLHLYLDQGGWGQHRYIWTDDLVTWSTPISLLTTSWPWSGGGIASDGDTIVIASREDLWTSAVIHIAFSDDRGATWSESTADLATLAGATRTKNRNSWVSDFGFSLSGGYAWLTVPIVHSVSDRIVTLKSSPLADGGPLTWSVERTYDRDDWHGAMHVTDSTTGTGYLAITGFVDLTGAAADYNQRIIPVQDLEDGVEATAHACTPPADQYARINWHGFVTTGTMLRTGHQYGNHSLGIAVEE